MLEVDLKASLRAVVRTALRRHLATSGLVVLCELVVVTVIVWSASGKIPRLVVAFVVWLKLMG